MCLWYVADGKWVIVGMVIAGVVAYWNTRAIWLSVCSRCEIKR